MMAKTQKTSSPKQDQTIGFELTPALIAFRRTPWYFDLTVGRVLSATFSRERCRMAALCG
jgi:hypothetical protein